MPITNKDTLEDPQSFYGVPYAYNCLSKKRRTQVILLMGLIVFTSITEVIGVGALLPFMAALVSPEKIFESDWAAPLIRTLELSEPPQLLAPLTLIFILATLFSGISRLLLLWCQTYLSYGIGSDFSTRMYKNILNQPYEIHVSKNSGDLIVGISRKSSDIVYHLILPTLTIISSSIILITISAFMFWINFHVTIFLFISLTSAYFLIGNINKRYLLVYGSEVNKNTNLSIRVLQEGLGGIRDVLIDGTQDIYVKAYKKADYQLRICQAKIQILSNCPRFMIESFGICLISLLAYFLVSDEDSLTVIPLLGVLALGIQRMLPVVQLIYSSWTSIKGGQQSVAEGLLLLGHEMPTVQNSFVQRKSIPFNCAIELLNISYRYSEVTPWVLNNVSLTIRKGDKVGLFGPSGGGKSTLLDILMGLLSPKLGQFRIDGVEVCDTNRGNWQVRVAHVPQDVYLSDNSIAENIAFGVSPNLIDMDKVFKAASRAQIAQTISELSNTYETVVGERGIKLSGGQKQRIGLARSLYKDADFLIFDEATSALDPETEELVMESIDGLGDELTVIMVAHRVSTLKNCNVLYEIKDGAIARSGTYAELFEVTN